MLTEKDQETRRHILKVAEDFFLAKGFKGVSMKDIAEEVQVTAAALYYHFPGGKQQLFVSMVHQSMQDWREQLYRSVEQADSLQEKLRKLTENSLNFHRTNQMIALIHDIEEYCREQVDRKMVEQLKQQEMQRLTDIFQQAIDAGEIAADTPASIYACMYQGIIMGLQIGHLKENANPIKQLNAQEIAAIVVDKLLNGIAHKG